MLDICGLSEWVKKDNEMYLVTLKMRESFGLSYCPRASRMLSLSVIHQHHDCVCLADGIVAVGREQDNLLFGKSGQQLEDLPLTHRVQACGWLIQDDQR